MNEGRTKKAATNIAFNLINQIITLALSFVTRTVFIWQLGAEYLGINGLFGDVLGLLSMADLGFGTAMVFSFYKPLAENDYKKMAGLTTFYKKIYTCIAIAVAVIGIIIIPFLPYLINLDSDIPNITIYYLLSLGNVVFSYLCVYQTSVLNADQKNYKVTRISIYVNIVRSIVQILGLILFKSYILYLAVGCFAVLANNIIASRKAVKEYPYIKEHVELDPQEKKNIFTNIGSVFIYKVSSTLLNTTDNILISSIVGTLFVGYYSNYLMLQNRISAFYTLIFTSLTASIGNLIVKENAKRRYEIFKCEQSVSNIICCVVIPCYVLLVNDFINIWVGEDYVLSNSTVFVIGLNMYLSCVLQPIWSYREATGLYRKTKWVMLICAALNILLSVILGIKIGLAGILLASALSRLLTYIWYEPKLLFTEYFDASPKSYYFQFAINFMLIVGIIAIGQRVSFFTVNSFATWLLKACIIGGFSVIITLAAYSRTEGVQLIKNRIKYYIGRDSK